MIDPESAAQMARGPVLHLRVLDVNELPTIWDDVQPLLERACSFSNGMFTPIGVVDGLLAGVYQMLALFDDGGEPRDIMVVSVTQCASGMRVLECLLVSGESMKAWMPFEPDMDRMALALGCHRVRMIGRKGFMKTLPHWKWSAVVLERDLSEEN